MCQPELVLVSTSWSQIYDHYEYVPYALGLLLEPLSAKCQKG